MTVASPMSPRLAARGLPWPWADRLLFATDPENRWERPSLIALLTATAAVYLWALGSQGWGNEYYAAAAQAGSRNWTALLFGSVDPGNVISVDKPPASLWAMGLSARLFGFNTWSLLLPQALMGIGSVWLLYATVRRTSRPGAGLLAGTFLAVTPVAALMFRYDNPDALLVLLLVVAAYCTVRAIETASTAWLALAGTAIGFAFLTKMLQALLVLPGLALAFLIAAPVGLWARIRKLLVAGLALVISGGWLVLLVELWPADSRPYVGGSTNNSLWQLTVGYNGFGRLLGSRQGTPFAGGSGGGMDIPSGIDIPSGMDLPGGMDSAEFELPPNGANKGITRLFTDAAATEISWLLPAALIGLVAVLWYIRRHPRTDPQRTALIVWGGWLLVTGLVFSYMSGIFHEYYTVALAPAIAAVLAIALGELWNRRTQLAARGTLVVMAVVTYGWSFYLLNRTPHWLPWLRIALVVGAVAIAVAVPVIRHTRRPTIAIVSAAVLLGVLGPAAYTLETITITHSGGMVASGPKPGDTRHGVDLTANPELAALLQRAGTRWSAAATGASSAAQMELSSGTSVIGIGGFARQDPAPTMEQFQRYVADAEVRYFVDTDSGGGVPGMGSGSTVSEQITAWVKANFTPTTVGNARVYDLQQRH
ncbi:4-amino-4-deoxy-L-arabinose transferase [Nocardia amikacinitolerans]|uniref:ArnT family glycosyltransferase n=1 Tax=Nocardia amikacinitolerans TaxID=756689 RepID=UPI000A00F209|nr:glycosyltransferase family 39 protein [Nocardia amikacinitolerans]MCP2320179.1 4-amino-4-deoxy-L-arabinose transferase [Nocardia amikacinitolerans]